MSVIKVIAVDDHALILEGIRVALSSESDIRMVATSREGAELIPLLRRHNPDVALVDLHMPGFTGPDVIRRASELFPRVRFAALTASRDDNLVRQVALAGANGYLLKESLLKDNFPEQIRRLFRGAITFDPEVVHALIQLKAMKLTMQEQECLTLMAQGLTNAGIAESLGLSPKRVANVLTSLYAKLEIDGLNEHRWVTRVVAVREALQRGLIQVAQLAPPDYR